MTLKEKLTENQISKIWLAERLGLSRPTLDKYLDKPDEFRIKHVRKISKLIHVTEREALVNYFIKA
jgi:predicted transcriptional regulator